MLKQLLDMKSNKIYVLQTAGKGTSCPACVWLTVPPLSTQTHTADEWQTAISRFAHTSYLNLWLIPIRSWKIRQEKDDRQGGRIPILGNFWNASTTATICSLETKENHLQTGIIG